MLQYVFTYPWFIARTLKIPASKSIRVAWQASVQDLDQRRFSSNETETITDEPTHRLSDGPTPRRTESGECD